MVTQRTGSAHGNGLAQAHFFFLPGFGALGLANALADVVERSVNGLGYELVDLEIAGGGLLRVYIDLPAAAYEAPRAEGALPPSVRVEDCEKVSHQLTHVLTVENIDYARLEVSSPGMDRPLKRAADWQRFAGELVSLKLRAPLAGRRNFTGVLHAQDAEGRWGLDLVEVPAPPRPGTKPARGAARPAARPASKAKAKAATASPAAAPPGGEDAVRRLSFTLDEVERARLVPRYTF